MSSIKICTPPDNALLNKYRADAVAKNHTDCYAVTIAKPVSLAEFVAAFYCTPLFKLERFMLKYLAGKPSTDEQAWQLAAGNSDGFAAWTVEARTPDQLLMCDYMERTRSWFMVTEGANGTLLRFGSAVVAKKNRRTGQLELGRGFNALLGFHKLYSRLLLHAAKVRLEKTSSTSNISN